GLNLKGDYGKAELQLIPNCGDVSFAMAGIVEDLSKCSPSKDDNGYFNLLRGKVEGEIKRLLYVGVTRARDYLITISMPSGQYNTIKPLDWIKNVIESSAPVVAVPTALDLPAAQANKTPVDFWGVPTHPAYYEQLADLGNTFSCSATTHMKLDSAAISTETTPKCISPSSSQEKYNATAALVDGFSSDYIEHGTIKEGESAAFGTCIHNYFAAHRWEGQANINANQYYNHALARQTVENHGMGAVLPKPKLLTQAADALFSYLEKTFGTGELLRETPFTYRRDNEQLVQGEIDLIWKTDKECILLDYKNFPAPEKWGKEIVLDDRSDNKFYVKKYFPQLGDYRAALTAAGENVTHVFIFYSVLGCLVEIKFE
ncbi:MAG: PD-(D/E)XK nuclease family protein, partial [Bacteroidales bacterium]|nr:PD-(D/E)XK nuclease family protein [Bacteroidales bacterium]